MCKLWAVLLLCVLLIAFSAAQAQDEPYQEILVIQQDERVNSVAWHPTENKLASASGSYIWIWDTQTGELLDAFKAYEGGEVTAITWSPQGDRLASIGNDLPEGYPLTVRIWDADTQELLYKPDAAFVQSVAWSPDGKHLVTVNDFARDSLHPLYVYWVWTSDNTGPGSIFQLTTGTAIKPFHNIPISAIWISEDQFVGVSSWGTVSVWDINRLVPITVFSDASGSPGGLVNYNQVLSWNSTNNLLAVSSNDNMRQSYGVNVIDLSAQEHFQLEESTYVNTVAWSPTGDKLASGNVDGLIQIWDVDTFETLAILHQEDPESSTEWSYEDVVTSISWSPDGAYLASGSGAGVVHIWDISP